jgi:prepilin-type N-terminal cleavage/methylation domain-containing protein
MGRLTGDQNQFQGFTLIELMIVVAILSVLVAIALPQFQRFSMKAMRTEGISILAGFHKAEIAFFASEDVYAVAGALMGIPPELEYDVPSPPKYYNVNSLSTRSNSGAIDSTEYGARLETINLTGLDSDSTKDRLCVFYPSTFLLANNCCNKPELAGQVNLYTDDILNLNPLQTGCQ